MFPWNYGFQWNPAHVIFLGAFYAVLATLSATLIAAARRARRDVRASREESIRWQSDFHDLPRRDRACRHALTGEIPGRVCSNGFDCRVCRIHGALVERHPAAAAQAPEEEVLGMSFPLDRFYHRGHTWARPEPDGTVTVGLDELGARLLGTPDSIELPQPGAAVQVNGAASRIRKRNAEVRLLAPVDGEVLETGGTGRGWLLKIAPAASGELAFRHLLRGAEIRPWLLGEIERLQLALTAEGAAPALADGGVPVPDIAAAYPAADWDAVCAEMFLE